MKWWALGLIAAGLTCVYSGMKSDATSSFEGGTFITEIFMIVGGLGLIVSGVIIFAVDIFISL